MSHAVWSGAVTEGCGPRRSPVVCLLMTTLTGLILGQAGPSVVVAAQPTVEYALGLKPFQPVEYDRPTPEEAGRCTITMEKGDQETAWVVRGADGQVLRRFSDTNGDRVVDRWSYYRNGFEVYRDIDSDFNAKADQTRWLSSAGSRWGVDQNEDGTLDRWKMLSPEEATAEVVSAVARGDAAAFRRLLPSRADLELAGFSGGLLEELTRRVAAAAAGFETLVSRQQPGGAKLRWNTMLAPTPGLLPAGAEGMTKDVQAYDNVVALTEDSAGGRAGQVYIGSLVRCGDVWRPIDPPQLPEGEGVVTESFAFFEPRAAALTPNGGGENERMKPLIDKLRGVEERLAVANGPARSRLVAEQVAVLEQVASSAVEADREFWMRQLIETLAAAVQDGSLDDGLSRLESLGESVAADEAMAAFVAFRLASARYAAGMMRSGADVEKVQSAWLVELAAFVEKYPRAADAAEAMLQMAIADEFSGRENQSLERYREIAERFPDMAAARKARGAARRLELVGAPLELAGQSVDGRSFGLQQFRGVPVLVHYWATWCEPCKVDIARIRELYAKYGPKKFGVVGVVLDTDTAGLRDFLQTSPLPWPQLHEVGGLDGPLAESFGVLTLPTMFLVDKNGKVVDRAVMITELEKKLLPLMGD
jgi:thiol-disulfide isomerase/thioredoxin